jgi:hypothetical protein
MVIIYQRHKLSDPLRVLANTKQPHSDDEMTTTVAAATTQLPIRKYVGLIRPCTYMDIFGLTQTRLIKIKPTAFRTMKPRSMENGRTILEGTCYLHLRG